MASVAASLAHLKTLTLPSSIFTPALINSIHQHWLSDLPPHASAPTPSHLSRWFGIGLTPTQRTAFDSSLRAAFSPALTALSPANYPLPPFTTYAQDRSNAGTLSMPLRRLDVLTTHDTEAKARAGLALVLLLDQVTRNIFRAVDAQPLVYTHYDRLARAFVYRVLELGGRTADVDAAAEHDARVADIAGIERTGANATSAARRTWFYMPLLHAEDLADHEAYGVLMQRFKREVEARGDEAGAGYVDRQLGFWRQHKGIIERFGRYPHRNEGMGREGTAEEERYLGGGGETFAV